MGFEQSLSIADDLEAVVNKEARDTANFVLDRLIDDTPIDTGRAKGSWDVALNEATRVERSPLRRRGTARREGRAVIKSAKNDNYPTIIITSNLVYMPRLNNGWSKQAPLKFIDLIAQSVGAAMFKGVTNG